MTAKIIKYSNKIMEFSLYAMAFYLPISYALFETFAGLGIFAWLLKQLMSGENFSNLFSRNFLSIPVLAYLIISISICVFRPQMPNRLGAIFNSIEYSLLFFMVSDVSNKKTFIRNILFVLIFIVTLVGFDGLYQHFKGVDFLRGRFLTIEGYVNGPFTKSEDFIDYIVSLLPLVAAVAFQKYKIKALFTFFVVLLIILFLSLILAGFNLYTMRSSALFWILLGLSVASKNTRFKI